MKFQSANHALEYLIRYNECPEWCFMVSIGGDGIRCWDAFVCTALDVERLVESFPAPAQAILLIYGANGRDEAVRAAQKSMKTIAGRRLAKQFKVYSATSLVKKVIQRFTHSLESAGYLDVDTQNLRTAA